jgi:hypothetical protein
MASALANPDLCIEFGAKIASWLECLKPQGITETAAVKRHCMSYATAKREHELSPDVPACSARASTAPKVVTLVAQSAGSHVAVHKIDIAWARRTAKWATRRCHGIVATQVA